MEVNNQEFNPIVLLIALLLIVGFTAIFYQRHQWDQYEQRYRELLSRKDPAAPQAPPATESAPQAPPATPAAVDTPPDQTPNP
jgi:hypothetical protein